jgi:hypothetical protein
MHSNQKTSERREELEGQAVAAGNSFRGEPPKLAVYPPKWAALRRLLTAVR